MQNAPDEDLVRWARGGDARAMALLVERYEPLLRQRARQGLSRAARRKVAESDVMQEANLAAFCHLERFEDRGPGSFRRWLGRIVRNKAADVQRHVGALKRGVRGEITQRSQEERAMALAHDPSPSSAAARAEEGASLRCALATLAGDDRMVIHLVHEQDKTFSEAGSVLGRTAEAARKLYGRAMIRLGNQLRRRT